MSKSNEHDSYIIPPNFIDSGSFFGGMFKARNTIEAGVLLLAVGIPVFMLGVSLTTKIIILCLTALPLALFALIGIGGESLSSFALIFLRYLRNRRVVGVQNEEPETAARPTKRKSVRKKTAKQKKPRQEDFPAEFDEVGRYSRRQRVREKLPHREMQPRKAKDKKTDKRPEPPAFLNPVAGYIPIEKVENGIIYTKDHRYIKILEVEPINFLLRSAREQRNIIYSFISFLKISPVKMQFKVLTKRADINRHLDTVRSELAQETDEGCRMLQEDYLGLVKQIGSKEAITRRFFIVFEYEPWANTKRGNEEGEAIAALSTATHTAENYMRQCGNRVLTPEDDNEFAVDVLYNILCRSTSCDKTLPTRAKEIVAKYVAAGRTEDLDSIPASEFCAPDSIDFTHGQYVKIDDVYHSYLLVPSDGFKSHVPAGWLSLIVNAGDGIDMDVFLTRQPKERIIQKLGQQLRINRSKIKETSDTNTDFDDLDGAIRSGYFLKEGLGNNEDFYYLNLLITVTANTVEELEWRLAEMKKLLLSQDMNVSTCSFREEQAFLSDFHWFRWRKSCMSVPSEMY